MSALRFSQPIVASRVVTAGAVLAIFSAALGACSSSTDDGEPNFQSMSGAANAGGGRAGASSAQGGRVSSAGFGGEATAQGGASGDSNSAGASPAPTCPLSKVYAAPCNSLVPSGPRVTSTCSTADPPAPEGGSPVDGIYVLESATWYGDCQDAQTVQSTWIMCGDLWNSAVASITTDVTVTRTNYTAAPQGTSVTLNPICVSSGTTAGMARDFSVAPGKLSLLSHYGTSTLVNVYSLQK